MHKNVRMTLEVMKMTTVKVDPKLSEQSTKLPDGSTIYISDMYRGKHSDIVHFNFFNSAHMDFCINKERLVNNEQVTAHTLSKHEEFLIKLI